MENASKALTMAANLLLAVIILSLIMYFYNELRVIPLEEDLAKAVEQAQEFNKQYEVYDKKIMYGVDVISAINKAISNNEKYIQGSWLSGQLSQTEFGIDVVVVLAKPLEETITVRAYQGEKESNYTNGNGPEDLAYKNIVFADFLDGRAMVTPAFRVPNSNYKNIYEGSFDFLDYELKTQVVNDDINSNDKRIALKCDLTDDNNTSKVYQDGENKRCVYSLFPSDSNGNSIITKDGIDHKHNYLKYLVSAITTFTESNGQTVYNKQENNEHVLNISMSTSGWSSMTWKPAIIDLKNRKFKCVGVDEDGKMTGEPGIVYSDTTGAITKLMFVEYELKD